MQPNSDPKPKPRSILSRSYKDGNRPAVSHFDLEKCRQALRGTFQDCDRAEFRLVTCLISCILNCARWFSRREILAATTLFDPDLDQDRHLDSDPVSYVAERPLRAQRSQNEHWLRKCNHIIVETVEGYMTFRSRAMRVFLRNFSIQGIDTSHRTLALICRTQMNLDRRFVRDVTSLADQPAVLQAVHVLSPYVAAFGNHHLEVASLTSIISIAEDPVLTKIKDSVSKTSDDFEIIQNGTKQLSLSEEGDDWMLLSSDPTMTPSGRHLQTPMS